MYMKDVEWVLLYEYVIQWRASREWLFNEWIIVYIDWYVMSDLQEMMYNEWLKVKDVERMVYSKLSCAVTDVNFNNNTFS